MLQAAINILYRQIVRNVEYYNNKFTSSMKTIYILLRN